MSSHQEDLDLLLSLQDRVLETPPASPSPGYLSDDGSPRQRGQVDMSAFRNVVKDCLDYEPKPVDKTGKLNQSKNLNNPEVEKFSGLRIRNLLEGDTLSGCWATVGVLIERGNPKTSSIGKNYCIWKIGCLDENAVSIFLFGDAYQQNLKAQAGTVFALFNCTVRRDTKGPGFSLSVSSPSQILKMGTSVDHGVCKGKRKDGMACTVVINKRKGIYCKYHKVKTSDQFSTMRTELKGGNLRTAFKDPYKPEGVYMVDPLADRSNSTKSKQPVKVLSVEALRNALSNAGKVTTNTHSQGIRFLNEVAASGKMACLQKTSLDKRKSSTVKTSSSGVDQKPDNKRKKTDVDQALMDKTKQGTGKMIELNYVSSDEEN